MTEGQRLFCFFVWKIFLEKDANFVKNGAIISEMVYTE
jgi:hypothetical protein